MRLSSAVTEVAKVFGTQFELSGWASTSAC
ncbi:cell division protein FtsX [Klebsiella variicola]|nr:cell division protein FtsX [Klebsiella variicola]